MRDGRKKNGGTLGNRGGGRKPKSVEQGIVEKLLPLEAKAFKALEAGLDDQRSWAVKIYMEYVYGKPKEQMTLNVIREQYLFADDE